MNNSSQILVAAAAGNAGNTPDAGATRDEQSNLSVPAGAPLPAGANSGSGAPGAGQSAAAFTGLEAAVAGLKLNPAQQQAAETELVGTVVDLLQQVAPLMIKDGWRTSECWMLGASILGAHAMALSGHLSGTLATVLSIGGTLVYLFVRTNHKTSAGQGLAQMIPGIVGIVAQQKGAAK
jgi:hypothetical protein